MKTQSQTLRARVNPSALEQALEFYGWSYRQLGERSGVSPSAISQYITGKRPHCTVGTARKLAEALRVDTGDIFFLEVSDVKNPILQPR